jgi:hypothetical protein
MDKNAVFSMLNTTQSGLDGGLMNYLMNFCLQPAVIRRDCLADR